MTGKVGSFQMWKISFGKVFALIGEVFGCILPSKPKLFGAHLIFDIAR